MDEKDVARDVARLTDEAENATSAVSRLRRAGTQSGQGIKGVEEAEMSRKNNSGIRYSLLSTKYKGKNTVQIFIIQ